MTVAQRQRISRAFSAARDYDRHARVQRLVAEELAAYLARLDISSGARVLEIGCGTGFLTEAAAHAGVGGDWLVTDLSPEMVERCRARMGDRPRFQFATLDGEHGERPPGPRFDLICASLALQWFADLPGAVARLSTWLAPGGHLVFTTLASGTFGEWREAHRAAGVQCGLLPLPSVSTLEAMQPHLRAQPLSVTRHTDHPGSAREFLHGLKAIGANTAAPGHRPLPPRALRRVMCAFEDSGAHVTYEVVTCHYRAGEG